MKSLALVLALASLSAVTLLARSASAEEDKKTARMWKAKCSSCHGVDGAGQTEQGKKAGVADMTTAAWQKEVDDAKIKDVLAKGIKREKNGKQQEMEAFGKEMTPEQIDALIKLIRTFQK
jgi:mono/diheme cytochrome c family protein